LSAQNISLLSATVILIRLPITGTLPHLYAILWLPDEDPSVLTKEQDAAVMKKLAVVQDD